MLPIDPTKGNGRVFYKLFVTPGITSLVKRDQVNAFCKKEMKDFEFGGLANWDGKFRYLLILMI